MAPDLNSVPTSPRNTPNPQPSSGGAPSSSQPTSQHASTPASRRASQIYPMSPPPLPLASPGGTIPPSAQGSYGTHAFPPLSPGISGQGPNVDAAGVPMRHPRPLTAAELHLELEKEQEAVVNRLTRELSALRAHSASVASTASSTASNVLLDGTDPHTGALVGPSHPSSARRHRSSSSVSRASMTSPYAGPATFTTGIPLTSATASIPHSHHRYSISSQPGGPGVTSDPSSAGQGQRSASVVSTPRYEEVAHYRQELEEAKRENELLKRRIRELERMISGNNANADGVRGRRSGSAQRNGHANGVTNGEAATTTNGIDADERPAR